MDGAVFEGEAVTPFSSKYCSWTNPVVGYKTTFRYLKKKIGNQVSDTLKVSDTSRSTGFVQEQNFEEKMARENQSLGHFFLGQFAVLNFDFNFMKHPHTLHWKVTFKSFGQVLQMSSLALISFSGRYFLLSRRSVIAMLFDFWVLSFG